MLTVCVDYERRTPRTETVCGRGVGVGGWVVMSVCVCVCVILAFSLPKDMAVFGICSSVFAWKPNILLQEWTLF